MSHSPAWQPEEHNVHPVYRPDIDGLRAVAILSVVIFHAFPLSLLGWFVGVDVFFVISGFLISTIIFRSLQRGDFSFAEFYAHRIKRIFPALIVVLMASYAFGWFALLPNEFKQLGKHMAAGAGFIQNFILLQEAGYFDTAAELKPLLHLWSLAIEEQFYLIYPVLIFAVWRIGVNVLIVVLGLGLISFVMNISGVTTYPTETFFMPQTRVWELLAGSVLAYLQFFKRAKFYASMQRWMVHPILFRHPPQSARRNEMLNNVLSVVGLLLLVVAVLFINKRDPFPGWWALLPVLGTSLLILAGPEGLGNRIILANKLLVSVGLISFPLYLWHWPILSFARIIESENPSREIRMGAVALSLVLSWLTYRLIEKPIRFGKNTWTKTAVLTVSLAVVGYVGYNAYKSDGLSFRLNESIRSVNDISTVGHPDVKVIECSKHIPEFSNLVFDGGCHLTKDEVPTVLFVGDSHTMHFKNAIWDSFTDHSVLFVAQMRCLPFSSDVLMGGECKKRFTAIIEYLEKNQSVKYVFLSGYWSYLMSGSFGKTGPNWRNAKELTEQNIETFKMNANEFISRIIKTGKQVVLIKDIPDLDFDVYSCFDNRPLRMTPPNIRHDCSMNEANYIHRRAPYDLVVDEILRSFPNVMSYDPVPLFCKNGRCTAKDSVLPYYLNGDHVNHFGASMVFKGLLDDLGYIHK